jgi:hypothetical protein
MEKTADYGICVPSPRYMDEHPGGPGLAGMVSEMLDNIGQRS